MRSSLALLGFLFCSFGHGADVTGEDAAIYGGRAGKNLKAEKFVFADRQQFAPTSRPLYVVGVDNKCYLGSFHLLDNIKTMVINYASPATFNKCIYQKKFLSEPSGFSIFEAGGGLCKSTYAKDLADLDKNAGKALAVIDKPISISHCTTDTVSFGEALEAARNAPSPTPTPKPTPVPTPTATPKPKIVVAEKPKSTLVPKPTAVPKHKLLFTTKALPTVAEQSKVAVTKPVVVKPMVAKPSPTEAPLRISVVYSKKPHLYDDDPVPRPVKAAPKAKVLAKATPTPAPISVEDEAKYTVQVASTTNLHEGEALAAKLKALNLGPIFVFDVTLDNTKYHRVCIGRFETARAARDFIAKNKTSLASPKAFVQFYKNKK